MKKVYPVIIMLMVNILLANQDITKERIFEWLANSKGFEKNMGQVTNFDKNPVNSVLAKLNLKDFSIFITDKGVSFMIYRGKKLKVKNQKLKPDCQLSSGPIQYARIDLELLNADISRIEYEDEISEYTNYYYPSSPDGILYVKSYRKVKIKNIYPGIDWVFRIENNELHHEFVIEPGADYRKIKMKVKWADIEIEAGKKIKFKTPLGEIQDGKIFAYEKPKLKTQKSKPEIYYKLENNIISFDVKNYSGENTLIIDPPLSLL